MCLASAGDRMFWNVQMENSRPKKWNILERSRWRNERWENQIQISEARQNKRTNDQSEIEGKQISSKNNHNKKIAIGVEILADLLFTPPVFWTKCEKFKFGQKTKITEGDELGFFAEKFGIDLPVILGLYVCKTRCKT